MPGVCRSGRAGERVERGLHCACAQVAKLRAYHYTAQSVPEKAQLAHFGLDLVKGALRNNVEAGVIEPVLAKTKILQARRAQLCLAT